MGLMLILPAQKQVSKSGSSDELYIIIRGKAPINVGNGNGELGRLDALYLPIEKPRTTRSHGKEPISIMWIHESRRLYRGVDEWQKI